jgi:hypothetical protein
MLCLILIFVLFKKDFKVRQLFTGLALFIVLLFPIGLEVKAQDRTQELNIAWFGEMLGHPGIKINYNYGLYENNNSALMAGAQFITYKHTNYNNNILIGPSMKYQYCFTKARISADIYASYQAQSPDRPTFKYEEGKFIKNKSFHSCFAPGFSLSYSRPILELQNEKIMSFEGGLGNFWQYPFNDQWIPHPYMYLGINISIN